MTKPHQHAHFARQIEQFKLIALRGNESLRICTEYSSYFSRRFCRKPSPINLMNAKDVGIDLKKNKVPFIYKT